MAKTNYSFGKRQRELEREKKKQDKEARKRERASSGGNIPIATVEELQGGGNLMSIDEVMQSMRSGEDGESAPQPQRTIPSRLFVGGLSWGTTTDRLREMFEAVGRVADAVVMVDRDTGDSRGFGFVTMADRRDASEAIRRLDGADVDGRTLVVRQATERGR
jgi:hypothetical protein